MVQWPLFRGHGGASAGHAGAGMEREHVAVSLLKTGAAGVHNCQPTFLADKGCVESPCFLAWGAGIVCLMDASCASMICLLDGGASVLLA